MKTRLAQLRVKIKSLAAEAKIIKHEERKAKAKGDYRLLFDLKDHRRGEVGEEARNSLLAYGFLRGLPYARMEPACAYDNKPTFGAVYDIAKRFGPIRETESYRSPFWIERAYNRSDNCPWMEKLIQEPQEEFDARVTAFEEQWKEWKAAANEHLAAQDKLFWERARIQAVCAVEQRVAR